MSRLALLDLTFSSVLLNVTQLIITNLFAQVCFMKWCGDTDGIPVPWKCNGKIGFRRPSNPLPSRTLLIHKYKLEAVQISSLN